MQNHNLHYILAFGTLMPDGQDDAAYRLLDKHERKTASVAGIDIRVIEYPNYSEPVLNDLPPQLELKMYYPTRDENSPTREYTVLAVNDEQRALLGQYNYSALEWGMADPATVIGTIDGQPVEIEIEFLRNGFPTRKVEANDGPYLMSKEGAQISVDITRRNMGLEIVDAELRSIHTEGPSTSYQSRK